jgi:hypothetical protein
MTDTPAPVSAEAPAPDLVETLLAEGRHFRGEPDCVGPTVTLLVERAADTITALRAENERLNTLVQTMRYAEDENHLAVLRENERLTAALAKQYSALQWIDQQRYCRRETIQEGNAFEMAKKLNEKLVLIMNRAGDAITGMLEPDNRRLLRKSPPPYVR